MIVYSLVLAKLALGLLCLIVQINLLGKGNLAPTSATDQVQNYVLGGIIGGVIYTSAISMIDFLLVLVAWTLLVLLLKFIKANNIGGRQAQRLLGRSGTGRRVRAVGGLQARGSRQLDPGHRPICCPVGGRPRRAAGGPSPDTGRGGRAPVRVVGFGLGRGRRPGSRRRARRRLPGPGRTAHGRTERRPPRRLGRSRPGLRLLRLTPCWAGLISRPARPVRPA